MEGNSSYSFPQIEFETTTTTTTTTSTSLPYVIFTPDSTPHFIPHPPFLSLSDSDPMDIDPNFHHIFYDDDDHHDDVNDDVRFITNLFNRSHSHSVDNNPSLHLALGLPHPDPIPHDLDLELGLGFHRQDSDSSTSTSASQSESQQLELGLGFGFAHNTDPPPFEGLRVVGLDSDSDSDVIDVGLGAVTDFDRPPFCWDYLGFNDHMNNAFIHHSRVDSPDSHFVTHCLGFDDHFRLLETRTHSTDHGVIHDDDSFTHVHYHYHHHAVNDDQATAIPLDMDDDGEREVREVSRLFDTYRQRATEHEVMIPSDTDDAADLDIDDAIRDLEWEILLAVNNFNREVYEMDFNADMYDAILTDVDERTDESSRDGRPAADSVIRNLSVVRLSAESLKENHVACAICKDDFAVEEGLRQLPCSHYYHGNCIIPWLKIRNTCPVCRYQLPTEDPNCQDLKREREESSTTTEGDASANSEVGLGFHVFL